MAGDSFRNRKNGFQTMDGNNILPAGASTGKIIGIVALIIVLLIGIFGSTYQIREQE